MGVFVAADDATGLAVDAIETVDASTDQYAVHCGAGLVDVAGDAVGRVDDPSECLDTA